MPFAPAIFGNETLHEDLFPVGWSSRSRPSPVNDRSTSGLPLARLSTSEIARVAAVLSAR
jgi:hypothetical protein